MKRWRIALTTRLCSSRRDSEHEISDLVQMGPIIAGLGDFNTAYIVITELVSKAEAVETTKPPESAP